MELSRRNMMLLSAATLAAPTPSSAIAALPTDPFDPSHPLHLKMVQRYTLRSDERHAIYNPAVGLAD